MSRTPDRFSQLYIQKGAPVSDSVRMRVRLAQTVEDFNITNQVPATILLRELGCTFKYNSNNGLMWKYLFAQGELRDILDVHFVIISELNRKGYRDLSSRYITAVGRIFREENLCYTINDDGEVHFAQDAEFQRNSLSTVASLGVPRYRAALDHFLAGQKALDNIPPRTREAVRQTYEAVETVFKLIFPEAAILAPNEVEKKLKPLATQGHQGTERDAINGLLNAFRQWVISCQGCRHGNGGEEPDNPTVATAVLSVSSGASYLRWLSEIDATRVESKNQTATGG